MKKLFITILFLICFTGLLHASDLIISQDGKQIGRMSPAQFELVVTSADKYKQLMLAQKEQRVSIQCDKVVATSTQGLYTTTLKIVWKDKQGNELNYITSALTLNINNDNSQLLPEWRIKYRDISEIGFPITGGLIVLVLLILL